ncbi:MAG: CheR family methyltransferase [Isosphaeraceae bacterium]
MPQGDSKPQSGQGGGLPQPSSGSQPEPWSVEDFAPVVSFLRQKIGITLESHRMGLLQARLRARLQQRGFSSFYSFVDKVLRVDPTGPGMQLLVDLSTVNHTSFFREPAHFTFLAEQLQQAIREAAGTPVRIWSAGCSSGQEPYSLAMILVDKIPNLTPQKVEIWASDLSLEVVTYAARAIYNTRDVAGVPPELLRRYLMRGTGPKDGTYRVVPEVRDLVKFRHLDLRSSNWGVPNDFHAVLCRNVSIYFADEERIRLLDRLAGCLRTGGWLIMGNGEILPTIPAALRKVLPSVYRKES